METIHICARQHSSENMGWRADSSTRAAVYCREFENGWELDSAACSGGPLWEEAWATASGGQQQQWHRQEEAAFVWGSIPVSLPAGASSLPLSFQYNLAKATRLCEEGVTSLCLDNRSRRKSFPQLLGLWMPQAGHFLSRFETSK